MLASKCNSTPFYLAVVTFLQSDLLLVTGNGRVLPGLLNNYVAIAVGNLLAKLKQQNVEFGFALIEADFAFLDPILIAAPVNS